MYWKKTVSQNYDEKKKDQFYAIDFRFRCIRFYENNNHSNNNDDDKKKRDEQEKKERPEMQDPDFAVNVNQQHSFTQHHIL